MSGRVRRGECGDQPRQRGHARWSHLHPHLEPGLTTPLHWSDGHAPHDRATVQQALDGIVEHPVTAFTDMIGLWR